MFVNMECLNGCINVLVLLVAEVISLVDEQIQNQSYGRLFAVLYADQRQFKVTSGDLIMLNHDVGVVPGTKIVLDKVRSIHRMHHFHMVLTDRSHFFLY